MKADIRSGQLWKFKHLIELVLSVDEDVITFLITSTRDGHTGVFEDSVELIEELIGVHGGFELVQDA